MHRNLKTNVTINVPECRRSNKQQSKHRQKNEKFEMTV